MPAVSLDIRIFFAQQSICIAAERFARFIFGSVSNAIHHKKRIKCHDLRLCAIGHCECESNALTVIPCVRVVFLIDNHILQIP